MKSFAVASILLAVLIALIVGNAIYIHHVSDGILLRLENLSMESTHDEVMAVGLYWERHRPFVRLSLGYRDLDRLNESLIALQASHLSDDASDFERYRRLCLDAARELARLERFSPENLF